MEAFSPDFFGFVQDHPFLFPLLGLLAMVWQALVLVWKALPYIERGTGRLVKFGVRMVRHWRRFRGLIRRGARQCPCGRKVLIARKKARRRKQRLTGSEEPEGALTTSTTDGVTLVD